MPLTPKDLERFGTSLSESVNKNVELNLLPLIQRIVALEKSDEKTRETIDGTNGDNNGLKIAVDRLTQTSGRNAWFVKTIAAGLIATIITVIAGFIFKK